MPGDLDFFKRFLYEAPGDDPPPDISQDNEQDNSPPDIGDDSTNNDPPDIDDSGGIGDAPPDLDDSGFDDNFGDDTNNDSDGEQQQPELELDEKISAILNQRLYQRFLELLSKINSQISQMKDNGDVLYSITPESTEINRHLIKLDENINMYLNHYFMNSDYSKNRLFFNKCLNLLALLNQSFDAAVKKGVKSMDV